MNQNVKIALALALGFTIGFTLSKAITKSSQSDCDDNSNSEELKEEASKMGMEKSIAEKSNNDFPLQLGSKGQRVKRLQIFLMRQLGWVRQPNGEFDLLTKERTLKCFKKDQIDQEMYEQLMLDKMVHDQRKKKTA